MTVKPAHDTMMIIECTEWFIEFDLHSEYGNRWQKNTSLDRESLRRRESMNQSPAKARRLWL